MRDLYVAYETWKEVDDANPWPNYYVEKTGGYHVITGHKDYVFVSWATAADGTEFETHRKSSATSAASVDDAIARVVGLSIKPVPQNLDGVTRVESVPRTGTKTQQYSIDFATKSTWYASSTRHTGIALTDLGAGQWQVPEASTIVDVKHGRIPFEYNIRSEYCLNVYDDGTLLTEDGPDGTQNDYAVNYDTGIITLHSPPTGTVTADYSLVVDSTFKIAPKTGKRLTLVKSELQFALDVSLHDTLIFELRGGAGLDPRIPGTDNGDGTFTIDGGPTVPTGTQVAMTTNTYQTVLDVIAESNLSYPVINKTTNPSPTWRDLGEDLQIFTWDYASQAVIDMRDSWANEVVVWFENHAPAEGWMAIATFYALSQDE